jgi:hypothetical protein
MPDLDPNASTSSRPLPAPGLTPPGAGDVLPMPMPIAPGEPAPGGGRIRFVTGTEGDDRLVIEGGATAIGGGGDDIFVLVSSGDGKDSEHLGAILDFDAGDKLDLSRLGDKAAILGREALGGGQRVSIDYDGDGKEDGFLLTFEKGAVSPEPGDGGFTILPFPMPVDFDGGIGDGEFHILPYPMPGDGEVTLLSSVDGVAIGRVMGDWAI